MRPGYASFEPAAPPDTWLNPGPRAFERDKPAIDREAGGPPALNTPDLANGTAWPPAEDEPRSDPRRETAPAQDRGTDGLGITFARLAEVAIESTRREVTYSARYMSISYPMGDVPETLGVCSDVVVRSYRAFGIDLQELVHLARVGIGDTSIDHRRVEVLRRYFAAYGESLPVSPFPEDYKPGDIVTYGVPHGRTSKAHIAIVTGILAPNGRPMIVHNRAWGPKLEDGLFHERISGHYRYDGVRRPDRTIPRPVKTRDIRQTAAGRRLASR